MKLLLDTHCLLWALADAPELSAGAKRAIADAEGVWFSEASIWELGLKWRKGKINVQPRRIFTQAIHDGFHSLSITMDDMLASCELRHRHDDPFDRLFYAQAMRANCRLLTIDRTLQQFGSRILNPK